MVIKNIWKAYRELGHKQFMHKWKEGIMKIAPDEIIRIELISAAGIIAGLLISAVFFIIRGFWYI
jgi:hypothetical protein